MNLKTEILEILKQDKDLRNFLVYKTRTPESTLRHWINTNSQMLTQNHIVSEMAFHLGKQPLDLIELDEVLIAQAVKAKVRV